MARDFATELARLDQRIKNIEKGQRYAHGGSIENNALQVRDGDGSLRAILGVQSDGTTAVNIVNGPPPPVPAAPILGSVLGGITVSWNGTFADGAVPPLDWQRVEVHASTEDGFIASLETLKSTFETPQGGTVVVACDEPVYVRLIARNTSGTASEPTAQAGPLGPSPVVATDILDGIVTTVKLADDAVTQAKVAAGAIGTTEITDNAITTPKIVTGAVQTAQIDAGAVNTDKLAAGSVTTLKLAALAVTADVLAANAVTAGKIAAGAVTTNALTVGIAQSIGQKLTDSMADATAWQQVADSGTWQVLTGVTDAGTGGTVFEVTGRTALEHRQNIPFDPDALYKVTVRVRTTVAPTTGTPTVYLGLAGIAADGTTRVNVTGANDVALQHYVVASNQTIAVGTAWTTITGYLRGHAAVGVNGTNTPRPDPKTPGLAHAGVRYIRPLIRLLYGSTAGGVQQVDLVAVETVPTGVVNSVNIADGAITAVKLDADAITGKTITGGEINGSTITGALIQTEATGERITLNEADANKVLVYNDDNVAINELSARGLLVQGTSGAVMWLAPNLTYPALLLYNAAGTKAANVAVSEPVTGDANLEMVSGPFSANGYNQMVWRSVLARDAAVIERLAADATPSARRIGGRIFMNGALANFGYVNEDTPAETTTFIAEPNLATVGNGRLAVSAPASSFSALYVEAGVAHTGYLLRLFRDSANRFTVDKDGNTTVSGMLTTGNQAVGRVTITPSAANTPTSTTVTYAQLKGTTFDGFACSATTVPGTRVTGVSMSAVSATSAVVWMTRTDTNATSVSWQVIGR
ncbi:putative PCQ3_55 (plasmid) [Streptomyces ambofaciens ATCC 23877]|uniref:Putative PCQ3_55 n=1 Tax=Streptomyces ambofaciens (strain ATCC 23877 / 3486 / DSM 40053 / JCM 4204 / NBRC 12836 / NRRL B-2516) TaxID=278992 RepID=A0A0K2B6D3_STRA7|nr:hypothetical protein [Streptomyces ambofaciens]AKZ60824.1 putative PCQ3_55 [Streptomyces ambofaciens ATCC 23877]